MEEEYQITFSQLLKDYPFIAKGLKKIQIIIPLDLQEQLLSIPNQLQNLIITAPEGCGKKLSLLILAIKRFANEQQGILGLVSHSKDMSQQLASICSIICRTPIVNLFTEKCQNNFKKILIIGSPLQLNNLQKSLKDKITQLSIFQADYLFSFGYGDHLQKLASSLPKQAFYQISCIKKGLEIQSFKTKWMKKITKIDYQPPQQQKNPQVQKIQGQISHFYEVGDNMMAPISLYVTLKFGLVNPKTLILVNDLREVYRYYLFLERSRISGIGLYNHQNPVDLKFYCLELWMNGSNNILVATKKIYEDLKSNVFKENCRKNYKKNNFALINLSTVICINLRHIEDSYSQIFNNFNHKPVLMTFCDNNEEQVESLQKLIKLAENNFQSSKSKEYPISKNQLDAFRYRVSDVFKSLGNRKIEMFQKYDFKKKMLKSPDLKSYFQENGKEKQILVKEISDLKKQINHQTVILSESIPSYLVPESLKASYQQQQKSMQKQMKNQEVPAYISKARNALRHVDLEEEDPEVTDISRLKLISSRKRWKLQHGFKLKKKNRRQQKKGIFQNP